MCTVTGSAQRRGRGGVVRCRGSRQGSHDHGGRGPRQAVEGRPPADILKINAWLRQYAGTAHAIYADYFTAVVDEKGMLKEGISRDGLHPNDKGYEMMAPVAAAAIAEALGTK